MGDGSAYKNRRNYVIAFRTTSDEYAELITKAIKAVCPRLRTHRYEHNLTRRLPNGIIRTDRMIDIRFDSKIIWKIVTDNKKNYVWNVPPILTTDESILGFLAGLYDAEGFVIINKKRPCCSYIGIGFKERVNCEKVKELLSRFNIKSIVTRRSKGHYETWITNKKSKKIFKTLIGFRLSEKRKKLNMICD